MKPLQKTIASDAFDARVRRLARAKFPKRVQYVLDRAHEILAVRGGEEDLALGIITDSNSIGSLASKVRAMVIRSPANGVTSIPPSVTLTSQLAEQVFFSTKHSETDIFDIIAVLKLFQAEGALDKLAEKHPFISQIIKLRYFSADYIVPYKELIKLLEASGSGKYKHQYIIDREMKGREWLVAYLVLKEESRKNREDFGRIVSVLLERKTHIPESELAKAKALVLEIEKLVGHVDAIATLIKSQRLHGLQLALRRFEAEGSS